MKNFYQLSESIHAGLPTQEQFLAFNPEICKLGDIVYPRTSLPQFDIRQGSRGQFIGLGENQMLKFKFADSEFSMPFDEAEDVFMIIRPKLDEEDYSR